MCKEDEELTGHWPHGQSSPVCLCASGMQWGEENHILRQSPVACFEDALTGLTWTCSSVKMGCSSIGGMGVLVVTDASKICLKTCKRDGQRLQVTVPLGFLATQQATEL